MTVRAQDRGAFLAGLPFPPDPFQLEAFDSLDQDHSVLVAAPTGSGKTLVADYAVARALAAGAKAFYTTPLKALSNQKFADLSAAHGPDRAGLLTGDVARNPRAPVVVMTTEVLRNMLLTGSDLLERLHTVILDEVHFLQDPYRGGVWEEVLVLTPPTARFVCLSATVANAADLGAWMTSVRGPTDVVVEQRRPIHLAHHVALRPRDGEVDLRPLLCRGRLAPEAAEIDRRTEAALRRGRPRQGPRRLLLPYATPRRSEVVGLLEERSMLPAIVFIFSRAGCDEAVRQCRSEGLRLTAAHERRTIRAIVEAHVEAISDEELTVLGYPEWLEALSSGIASHHAGLVPAFREAVEECFVRGLLKVVFATETLSLGINMPARTVVLERFAKFGGSGHATLTAGEYTQLTGRAGRRGLDHEGHAVVLFRPESPLAEVAEVATSDPPELHSAFRPSYNLAANLVQRFDRARALEVLRRSFAQWQLDHRAGGSRAPGPRRRPVNQLTEHLGRRLAVLEELGYVRGWQLTEAGGRLASLYHEADLLVAEALSEGLLDGAEPSTLAAVLASVVFEPRRSQRLRHRGPPGPRRRRRRASFALDASRRDDVDRRVGQLAEAARRLQALEEVHRLPRTRRPEGALGPAVLAWGRGAGLGQALELAAERGVDLAPGDFVRTVKQVADLVSQVALVAPEPATGEAARLALDRLVRAVVAAGEVTAGSPTRTVERP